MGAGWIKRGGILGGLASLGAFAQEATAPPGATPAVTEAVATESVATEEAVLPAETRPESFVYIADTKPDRIGRVMAPVYVNGVGPFAFIVDTGASSSVIGPRVVARLGIGPDPERSIVLRGITGSEVVPTVGIDSIEAGGIRLEHRELPVVEPHVFANSDGIFGADAFARGCLHVNFARKNIAIRDTGCPRSGSQWESVRAQLRFGGLLVIPTRIGSAQVAAIVDTGAERSLGNPALLRALKLEERARDPKTLTEVYAATSHATMGNLVPTPRIHIGSLVIGNLSVVYGDFDVFRLWGVNDEPAIVLGMDILGTARELMIDFRRAELRIVPRGDPALLPLRRKETTSRTFTSE